MERPAPDDQTSPERGRLGRTTRAVRSGLRRYPSELLASLLRQTPNPADQTRRVLCDLSAPGLSLCWLGHASVVVGASGTTVAVDPVLSGRIGPRIARRTVGVGRRTPAPIDPDSLRGVDLILITHAHFDHLDRPTLERLADPRTTVVVPPRCRRLIPPGFAGIHELTPGQSLTHGGVSLIAHSPRHWGARAVFDRRRGSCAYEMELGGSRVLFAGDTAHTHAFDDLRGLDLAVFGIGAYEPWEHMHATPEQVWRMYTRLEARLLLPVHHSTFRLSDEPDDEPMRRLLRVSGQDVDRILNPEPGEIVDVPTALPGATPPP